MNLSIFRKALRDALPMLLATFVAIIAFEVLFVRAVDEMPSDMGSQWLKLPFVKRMVRTLIGSDILDHMTPTGFMSIGFAHPLVYAFTWTLLLATGSRVMAGEVDRGTADLLLSLPVSRRGVYVSLSAMMVLIAIPISAAPLVGVAIGERLFPLQEPIRYSPLSILMVNLFALDLAVIGATLLFSARASRRGSPIAIVMALLLSSFLLNFLGQFWSAAERLGFLGLLHYYRPLPIISDGVWPVRSLLTLAAAACLAWGGGLWLFVRRDVPAV